MSYTVVVSDSLGCSDSIQVVVSDIPGPEIQGINAVNVSCNGLSDGEGIVSLTGGVSPISYLWDTGTGSQTDSIATGLSAGNYFVTITDASGCIDTSSVLITEPSAMSLLVSNVDADCGQNNGQASVQVSGGTAPYNYLWNDPSIQSTSTAISLLANTYLVFVTDSMGCVDSSLVVVNDIPGGIAQIQLPLLNPTCFGFCDGNISASMLGGTPQFTYLWSDPSGQTSSTATGLCAGTYSVTITDLLGCVSVADTSILDPEQIVLAGSGFPAKCKGVCDGIGIVTPAGTINPYSYVWDNLAGNQTTAMATGLCEGSYSVTVTDGNGCVDSLIYTVQVNPSSPIADFNVVNDTVTLLESNIEFFNTSLPFLDSMYFSWDFGDGGEDSVVNPIHNFIDTGTFIVQLIVRDSSGCVDTILKTIVIEDEYILFAPNAFTPNGDGDNDYFFPKGVGLENSVFKMYIYDRWGDEIFESSNVTHQWDGRANNGAEIAQEDVYVWLIETYKVNLQKAHRYIGHVTLIR